MQYPLTQEQMDMLQKFTARLNSMPDVSGIEKTPDGKAHTIVISHIEMTLDELFFGQWTTQNFTWSSIANEVQGSLELCVIHPVSGYEIRRTGAASIVITVDRVPDNIKDNPQQRNRWALDSNNKKPNALDLAFPKLKAECLKNAAISLGKIFGRDLNRGNKDEYKPFKLALQQQQAMLPQSTFEKILQAIRSGEDEYQIREAIVMLKDIISVEQLNQIETEFKNRTNE